MRGLLVCVWSVYKSFGGVVESMFVVFLEFGVGIFEGGVFGSFGFFDIVVLF